MSKHEKKHDAEVLLPVRGLAVLFDGGVPGKQWPGVIAFVHADTIEVDTTKPNGTVFRQTVPLTPGEKSPKGYSWSHV